MLFKTRTASVYGIEAYLVDVEVNLTASGSNGEFLVVGLPDTAVRESRSRVMAAIRNSGFGFPFQKITVNLAPADMKKEGSAFDLPMALGPCTAFTKSATSSMSACQVRDTSCSDSLQDPVVATCGETELVDRVLHDLFALRRQYVSTQYFRSCRGSICAFV